MPTDTAVAAAQLRLVRAQRLLHAARAALEGRTTLPARRRTRAAAVFARNALEHVVDAALRERGHDLSGASMRVRLICLSTLVDRAAGEMASVAWGGLSQGCHQHAYELSPTFPEVEHLIGLLEKVAAAARLGSPAAPEREPSATAGV